MRGARLLGWGLCTLVVVACDAERRRADGASSTPEERLQEWERESPDAPLPVALGFRRPVTDSALVSLLTRRRLRPYAVYLAVAGLASQQRVPRGEASLELVARSRQEALGQLRVSLCAQPDRARAMLEDSPGLLDEAGEGRVGAFLTHVDRLQADLLAVATGAPIFYGVEAVGSLADVRAAREEPLLSSVEPAGRMGERGERSLVVPQPPLDPELLGPEVAPEYAAMEAPDLRERFTSVAGGMEGCDDVERSEP